VILIVLLLLSSAIAVLLFCATGLLPAAHTALSVLCVIAGVLMLIPAAAVAVFCLSSRGSAGKRSN